VRKNVNKLSHFMFTLHRLSDKHSSFSQYQTLTVKRCNSALHKVLYKKSQITALLPCKLWDQSTVSCSLQIPTFQWSHTSICQETAVLYSK